ncbi:MAG: hypothetical protein WC866_00285 [Patescibacteria group bacterium]
MSFLFAFFTKLDAAVQKRFDSICFFFMRRFGVRKSMIRYALAAVAAVTLASALVQLGMWYGHPLIFGIIAAFSALVIVVEQTNNLGKDHEAEGSIQTASVADIGTDGVAKIACTIIGIVTVTALMDKPASISLCIGHFFICTLAHEYLKKTPMNPPAEKAREHVGTPQTAPAQT